MNRRAFVTGLGTLLAAQIAAEAQPGDKVRRVGFVLGAASSPPGVQIEPFKQSLRERGWIE